MFFFTGIYMQVQFIEYGVTETEVTTCAPVVGSWPPTKQK